MYISTLSFLFLIPAGLLATPLRKRYDLDGNGIPDICYTDKNNEAHCMLGGGSWTAFPASSASTMTTLPMRTPTSAVTTTTEASTTVPTTKASTLAVASLATGSLPAPAQFKADNGTKWSVEYVGEIGFTGTLASKPVVGDKCRTGTIGDKIIWNCGDVMCQPDWTVCGFSMGPAFYGTSSVMTIDTDGVTNVNNNDFMQPWLGDSAPVAPQTNWGMDTSNVAAINDTHGVAYAWEIWRGASDGSIVNRGIAVASITLGDTKPIATRVGPLLAGPNAIQLGLLAILRDGDYIYTYSIGGPSNLLVGRVSASDDVFDSTKHTFLQPRTSKTWVSVGVPSSTATNIGATTANTSGKFGCGVYGSVAYNNYLRKYVILCGIYMNFVNMYTSDTPWGPWSAEYGIQSGGMVAGSYGVMMHPEYSPDGTRTGKEFYFSIGPNSVFNVFKVSFGY